MPNPMPPEPRWCSCRVPDVGRRQVLGGLTAASALALAGWPGSASAATHGRSVTITVMGTSDIHSHAVNWDYYKDAEYADADGNTVGLARVSSLVNQIRADRGRDRTLLFDAATPSRAPRSASTTPPSSRSPRPARCTRWPAR